MFLSARHCVSLHCVSLCYAACRDTWPLTPRAHNVILGNREDDVAVAVVFDLCERTLVSGEKNWPHGCGLCGEGRDGGLYTAVGSVGKFGVSLISWFGGSKWAVEIHTSAEAGCAFLHQWPAVANDINSPADKTLDSHAEPHTPLHSHTMRRVSRLHQECLHQ